MEGMTPLELAIRVRERLSSPERWTKDASARKADGGGTGSTSPDAVCWCITGAAHRESGEPYCDSFPLRLSFYRALTSPSAEDAEPVLQFNDSPSTTHAMLLERLDEAIEKLRGIR